MIISIFLTAKLLSTPASFRRPKLSTSIPPSSRPGAQPIVALDILADASRVQHLYLMLFVSFFHFDRSWQMTASAGFWAPSLVTREIPGNAILGSTRRFRHRLRLRFWEYRLW
jgi:hypothetical protein